MTTAVNTLIAVRPLTQADFGAWHAYWAAYQVFYQVELDAAVTQTTWARFFDTAEPVHCAVAADETRIYGFVTYVYHRSTWGRHDFCYLEDLYVDPEARGHHVGKQLIEYVQAQAREQQCDRLYWHTQESNHTAQRLYDWVAQKPGVIEYRMPVGGAA